MKIKKLGCYSYAEINLLQRFIAAVKEWFK